MSDGIILDNDETRRISSLTNHACIRIWKLGKEQGPTSNNHQCHFAPLLQKR